MSTSHKDELKQKIEYIEKELANSRVRNLELENYLLKLKNEEMMKETVDVQLLKG
jgi:hypothetical protein